MSDQSRMSVTVGEPVTTHESKGGPVAAYVDELEIGDDTESVRVKASNLLDAITSDLADSYKDVYVYTNGDRLAVTDHEDAIDSSEEPQLSEFSEAVVRTDVLDITDDLTGTMVQRSHAEAALEVFGESVVTVYVDQNYPVVIENETKTIGIAPVVRPENVPGRQGGKPA